MTEIDSIAREIRDAARIQGTFTLRSGATSNTYFDKYRFETDPALLRADAVEPIGAICVIDRETGGMEALAAQGLPLRSLLTMSRIESLPSLPPASS